jgi:hypothetical protein
MVGGNIAGNNWDITGKARASDLFGRYDDYIL